MQQHTKQLIKSRGYNAVEGEPIPCEMCFNVAVDVHHIQYSSRGTRDDSPNNLIALCRICHDNTHKSWNQSIIDKQIEKVKFILKDKERRLEQCREYGFIF